MLVTAGATEAIAAALLALCEPGDEVVTFEPYYDSYAACIAMAGAQRRVVQLRTPDYVVRRRRARRARSRRERELLLLNSPHNPTGKVFSVDELDLIAQLCVEHDLVAITDEVYEHLVFDGEHVPAGDAARACANARSRSRRAARPSRAPAGRSVGSCAPPDLVAAVRTVKQFLTYVNGGAVPVRRRGRSRPAGDRRSGASPPTWRRSATGCPLGSPPPGSPCSRQRGTYFVTVDIRALGETDGLAFCRALPERCGVVAVPSVVFYDDKDVGNPLVRFACCKRLDVIDEAVARLKGLRA